MADTELGRRGEAEAWPAAEAGQGRGKRREGGSAGGEDRGSGRYRSKARQGAKAHQQQQPRQGMRQRGMTGEGGWGAGE